jgi:signal transduction histidine kinase
LSNNSSPGHLPASQGAGRWSAWRNGLAAARRALLTSFRRSLRAQVAIGIAVPVLLALLEFSVVRYWREDQFATDQTQLAISQLGQVVTGGLRHAMLKNDPEMLSAVLNDIGQAQAFRRVDIIDLTGQVRASTVPDDVGQSFMLDEAGCRECHKLPQGQLPTTTLLASKPDTLRIASPIVNEPACAACHPTTTAHLGMLLLDVPLTGLRRNLINELQIDLFISAGISVLVTVVVYMLVHWLVVERVEVFRRPLAEFASGIFEARLPVSRTADEIGELALAFNRMAEDLKRHAQEEEVRHELRQHAIVEERERIARELHDGLAQMLGYINTKAIAIRLLLGKNQVSAAETQLHQLETASHELFVDVRETILGLQMVGQGDIHLAEMLKEYSARFSQLSGLPVDIAISAEAEDIELPAETELQLLRIVQEALTNVRKHAAATGAFVSFQISNGEVVLTVCDNGQGFDPEQTRRDLPRTHFGLDIMRERAEAIGAIFSVESRPEAGVLVTLRRPIGEKP